MADEYDPTADEQPSDTTVAEQPAQEEWPGVPEQPRPMGRRELVHEGIKRTGASPVAQAAFMGDIEQESGFNARAVSDHGTSVGLFQTGRPMYGNYRREVQPKSEEEDLYLQPQYVIDQWKRRHPDRWAAMNAAPNAAEAEHIYRSTPGWGYGIAGKRYQHAMNYQRTLGVPELTVKDLDSGGENWPGVPAATNEPDEEAPEAAQPGAKQPLPQPLDPAVTPPEDVFLQGVLQKHLKEGAARGVYPRADAIPPEAGHPTTPDLGWPEAKSPADVYGQFGIPDTVAQQDAERARAAQRTGAPVEPAAAEDTALMPPEMVDTLKDVWKIGVRQASRGAAAAHPVIGTLEAIPQTRFIAEGIKQGVGELGAGFVGDTDNLALIAASEGLGLLPVGAGVAGRAVSGYFAYQMAKQLPDLWQQFKDAPDAQGKIAVATQGIGQIVMTAQAGLHAVGPGGGPPRYFKKIQAGEEAKARAAGDAFAKSYEEGYNEEPAPEAKTLSPDDRGMLHDEEQHYSDNEVLDPFHHPEGKKNPDGTFVLKTAQTTPEAKAHAQELAQTLKDGDRVTEAGDEDAPSWVVRRTKSKKTGRESLSIESEKGGEPVGYGRQALDADGNPTGPIIMDANGNSILQRSRIERKAATVDELPPEQRVSAPGAGGTVTSITAEAPKAKGQPPQLVDLFNRYLFEVEPQTGTGKPTFAEWQRGQKKGSIGKLPEPVVPGTAPETRRNQTVLDEIRNADANTTAKVQALFARPDQGGHQFTREQAAELRRQAWGEQVKPVKGQPVNKVLQGQRNKIAQRRFQSDYANLPEGGQLAVDLERQHQPKAIDRMSEDELHAGIESLDAELANTPDTPGIINKAGLLRVMQVKMRQQLQKIGKAPPPRTRPGLIPQNELGFREDDQGRLVRDAEGNIIQENAGSGRFPAIENSYHIAYAAEQEHPGVPLKDLEVIWIFDERAGRPGNRPVVANRIIRRGDKAAKDAIDKEFPSTEDYSQSVSTPKPYKARKGDVPSYEEWKAKKKPAPAPPVVTPPPPPAAPSVTAFQTSMGSFYTVHEDGTTSRNKAPRPDHPDHGDKQRSDKTVYVTPENMRFLSLPSTGWRMIDHGDGTMSLATMHQGKLGIPPSSRNIPVMDTPAVGLHPVELWDKKQVNGKPAYAKAHIGNDITSLGPAKAAPAAPTVFLSGTERSIKDIDASIAANKPFGATVVTDVKNGTTLSQTVRRKIVDYVQRGGKVFLDSGAAKAFKAGLRGETLEVPWERVWHAYREIAALAGKERGSRKGQLYIVMPDVVGDAEATAALQKKHAADIEELYKAGFNLIFPVQKAPGMDLFDAMRRAVPENPSQHMTGEVFAGIPFNDKAWTKPEVEAWLDRQKGRKLGIGIHLLGGGEADVNWFKGEADKRNVSVVEVTGDTSTGDANRARRYGPEAPPLPPTPRELQSGATREQVQADLAAGKPVNAFDVFGHKLEDELPDGYVREGDNFEKTAQPSKSGAYPNRNGVYDYGDADESAEQTIGKLAWQKNEIHVLELQDGNWISSVTNGLSGGGYGLSEKFGTYPTKAEAYQAAIKEMRRSAEALIARPDGGKAQVAAAKKTLPWLDELEKSKGKATPEEADDNVPDVVPADALHPREMTHAQVNNELDRLDKKDVELSKQLTAAGRGREMPSEIRTKNDLLSRHFTQVMDRKQALINEAARRLGGVRPSLDRLPVGKYSSRNPVTLIEPDKKGTNAKGKTPVTPTLPPELKKEVQKLEKKKAAPTTNQNMVVQKKYLLKALDDAIQAAPDVPDFEMPDDLVADRKAMEAAARERQKKPYADDNSAMKADQEQQQMLSKQIDKYGLTNWKVKELQPTDKVGGTEPKTDWRMVERDPRHVELMSELEIRVKAAEDRAVPKVVIEVPGDGTFSIVNSKEALKTFRKAAARDFPTTLAKASEPSKGKSVKPSAIPAVSKGATSLEDKVKVASIAASDDKTRYVLENTVFSTGDKLISTDGRRMVIIDHAGPKGVILDGTTAKKRTDWGENEKGEKNPEPTYPNWKQVIPEKKDMKKVATVDTADGIKLMKQAVQLAGDKNKIWVKLWVDKNGKLGVTAKTPEVGEFAGGEADPKTAKYLMTLDPEFIADGLKIARGLGHDKVDLWVKSTETEMSPMSLEAKGMRYVQMPVRASDGGTYSVKGIQLPSGAEQVHPMSPEAEPVPETPEVDPAAAFTAPAQADARAAQETVNERGLTDAEEQEVDDLYERKHGKGAPLNPTEDRRYNELIDKIHDAEDEGTEEHGFGGGTRQSKPQGFQPGPTNVPAQEKATMVERLAGHPLNPIGIVKSLLSGLAPGARGPKFLEAASELGRHLGKMHRRGEISMSELKKHEKMFDKLGVDRRGVAPEDNIGNKFASDMSMGRPIHPQFQEAWATVEKLLKSKLYALHNAGAGLKTVREHYFPGMWDQRSRLAFNAAVEEAIAQGVIDQKANLNLVTPEQAAWIKDRTDRHYERGTGSSEKDMIGYLSKRPMRGRESFRKEKIFEDYLQAQRLGLRPVSYNPISVMKLKFAELDRSIMAHEYFQSLKQKGLLKVIGPWEQVPEGWQKVPDPYGTIIGPPTVTIKEWLDRGVYDGLEKALTNIGGYHIRKINIGGSRLGYAQSGAGGRFTEGKTVTRFGTETSVLAHEVGHQLDFKFGLWDTLVKGAEGVGARGEVTKAASREARVKINNELRAIADLTGRGQYARKQVEKMAQVLEAYIHAPDLMKQVAPTVYSKFDEFVKATPQIAHLAELRPGLLLKQLESQKYVGMPIMGVRVIPNEHATIMDNYLSKSIYNSAYIGKPYKAWMSVANLINQSQLGMGSAFHFTFTLADAVTSNFANVLKDGYGVMTGSRDVGQLVATTGRAISTIVRTPYLGDKVLNAWRNSEPSMDARIMQVTRGLELGGARFEMEKGLETEQWGKMMKDWYSGRKLKGLLRSPVAVTEALAMPIMKLWVPRLKAGVAADMIWRVIEQNPGRTLEDLTPQFRQVWNRVDSRLGQVVYDRTFMRNVAKNTLQALIRAPGWTGGTIVELGGAFPDAGKFVADWIKTGHPPRELPDRVAYTMALLLGSVTTNALLTYAFTGERPRGLDFWAFRDGGTDEYGNPTRLMLPTYMKDILSYVEHPITTMGNKLHPIIGAMKELAQNKTYYGTEIRHPDDPWLPHHLPESYGPAGINKFLHQSQAGQLTSYALKTFEPFWWRGLEQQSRKAGGFNARAAAVPYFGIMPAPRHLTETPAEHEAHARQVANMKQGARTYEQSEASEKVKDVIRDIQLKRTTIQEAMREGRILPKDKKYVEFAVKSPALTRAIVHMGPEDVLAVWNKANPQERREIRQLFLDKIKRSHSLTKQRKNEIFRSTNE